MFCVTSLEESSMTDLRSNGRAILKTVKFPFDIKTNNSSSIVNKIKSGLVGVVVEGGGGGEREREKLPLPN